MKRNRIAFAILWILTLVFCYFYKGQFSSMFLYGILLLPIVSCAYMILIYFQFKYWQELDKKFVTKGEEINFKFSIHNESILLYPLIKVKFYNMNSLFVKTFQDKSFTVNPLSKKDYELTFECKYRGYYEFGIDSIYIGDLLGLFYIKHQILTPKCITVYPRIIPLNKFAVINSNTGDTEKLGRSNYEDNTMISDTRKYVQGDSIKKIHWKLSAKRQELLVRNYDNSLETAVNIIVDLTCNNYSNKENALIEDAVIESAIAVVHFCLKNFIPVQLIYFNEHMVTHYAKNMFDFDELYTVLFQMQFDQTVQFDEVVKLTQEVAIEDVDIVLVTANLNQMLYTQIYNLAELGKSVILIYVYTPTNKEKEEIEEIESIFRLLSEINVICYRLGPNDDIKKVLEQ